LAARGEGLATRELLRRGLAGPQNFPLRYKSVHPAPGAASRDAKLRTGVQRPYPDTARVLRARSAAYCFKERQLCEA
jgi:hypothetical protein